MHNSHDFLPTIEYYIDHYGSLGVFLASIVEELVAPIPSAFVQGMGGLLIMLNEPFSFLGLLQLILLVSIPASLGVCVGSLPYWYLSQKYGMTIIEKYGKYLGASPSDWKKLEGRMNKSRNDEYIFIAVRAFPAVPAIILALYGGAVGMSLRKYFTLSFIGIMIRSTILGSVGWLLGNSFLKNLGSIIESLEKIVIAGIILALGYLFYRHYLKNRLEK